MLQSGITPNKGKTFFYRLLALVWITIFLLAACATLPNVRDTLYYYDSNHLQKPPQIVGPHGKLSRKQRAAIVAKLKKQAGPTDILQKHVALVEDLSGAPLTAGNKVVLLPNGDATFAAMFRAIANARDHINMETFVFDDDRIGRIFAALFVQKRAQGLSVNVIYDSVGSYKTPREFFNRMHKAGVQILEYNPTNPLKVRNRWAIDERDHRKMLIVDGKVVITGGVNISSVHSARPSESLIISESFTPWHDTDVQIEGPAVAEYQKLFIDQWKQQDGPALASGNYFPPLEQKGPDLVRVIANSPGEWNRQMYIAYVSAIAFAENSIHLANAYFAPDKQTEHALLDAARRGVDIKIILPGMSNSRLAFYGGRSYYQRLLQAGVKIYEIKKGMLHTKTAVIDGVWSTVGSTNLDPWSLIRDDEVNAVILGPEFAEKMEDQFAKYLSDSNAILLTDWKKRPLSERFHEWISRILWYWL